MRTVVLACWTLCFSFFLRVNLVLSAANYEERTAPETADQCDWTGSGGGGRGVRPVYLRCLRGTVSWRYPRGALRIVLSPPILFRSEETGPFEPVARFDGPSVSDSRIESRTARFFGFRACTKVSGPARVYFESNGKLRLVYSPRDGKDDGSHRCFYTKKQPAAFYVEAEDFMSAENRRDTKLQYDLELRYADPRPRYGARHFWAESRNGDRQSVAKEKEEGEQEVVQEEADCRPCSMLELAKAYCQSDLVARGTISAVQRRPDYEAAELVVGIIKTLRRVEESETTNDIDVIETNGRKNIRVRVPTACDARHGQGEFVIMAKRRLGDLVLVCAPRLETWAKTVREMESAPCVLRS